MWRHVALMTAWSTAALAVPSLAQQLADEQSRRAALASYRAGQELMAAERFAQAAEQFSKAIEKDRLLTVAHYGLGQAYMGQRRYASAIQAYQKCVEAFRTLHGLQQVNRIAVERQRDDEIHELREAIQRMQALANRSPGSGLSLRVTQLEQHLRDVERQKTSVEGVFQPPAEVLLALGSAFFRNGQPEQAEFEWKAAIDANPKLGEAHNNLAVVYMQTGRYREAAEEIRAAERAGFRVNPQFKEDLKKASGR